MKRTLAFILAVVTAVSLCACSKDKKSAVKLPDSSSFAPSMSYEDAIAAFQYDEKLVAIDEWAGELKELSMLIYYYDIQCEASSVMEDGKTLSNQNGVTDCFNKLEELLKLEPDYTAYVQQKNDAAYKQTYDKFIVSVKNVYQEYVATPPTNDSNDIVIETDPTDVERYYQLMITDITRNDYYEAADYLKTYAARIYTRLASMEFFVWCGEENISNAAATNDSELSDIDKRNKSNGFFYNRWMRDIGDSYADSVISQIRDLLAYKSNFDAVAVKACSGDYDIKTYQDFMTEANNLYNTLLAHRPKYRDTDYIEKYGYNLDKLEGLCETLMAIR